MKESLFEKRKAARAARKGGGRQSFHQEAGAGGFDYDDDAPPSSDRRDNKKKGKPITEVIAKAASGARGLFITSAQKLEAWHLEQRREVAEREAKKAQQKGGSRPPTPQPDNRQQKPVFSRQRPEAPPVEPDSISGRIQFYDDRGELLTGDTTFKLSELDALRQAGMPIAIHKKEGWFGVVEEAERGKKKLSPFTPSDLKMIETVLSEEPPAPSRPGRQEPSQRHGRQETRTNRQNTDNDGDLFVRRSGDRQGAVTLGQSEESDENIAPQDLMEQLRRIARQDRQK